MEGALAASHIRNTLVARRDSIAEQWQRAVARTSYVPLSASEVLARLAHLVEEAIDVLLTDPLDAGRAKSIGQALAGMHYVRPDAAGATVGVLGRELIAGLSPEETVLLQPRICQLLDHLTSGYFRGSLDLILQEQEGIRNALLTGLRTAERQLRQARDDLEVRVEERTEALARANAELHREIAERTQAEVALRESEEKYRDLVENISDIIYALDRDGVITYISPAVGQHLGYDVEEVLGSHISRFVHPDDLARAERMLESVLQGDTFQNEYRILDRSGEVHWMRTSSRAIVVEDETVGVHGVLGDISDRKQMEQDLQESEARYRAVVQEQTDLICRFRPEGTYTFANEAYVGFYGRDDAEVRGKSFLGLMSPEGRVDYEERLDLLTPDAPVQTLERRSVRSDGRDSWLLWTLRGMFDEAGRLIEVQAVGRDITERRRAEEALRESEERWRSLVENAPDIVVTVDRRGDILFVNRLGEGAPGEPEDLIGTNAVGYAVAEHQPALRQAIEEVFERGQPSAHEVAVVTSAGTEAWQAIRLGPIWRNGEVTAAMLVLRDISERKKLEEMKDNLIRDVSHELRTPLAKVQMSLELLQEIISIEDADRERALRTSEIASRNVRRLLDTVEGILDLTRLEAGALAYRKEQIVVDELAQDVIAYMRPLAQAKGLRLRLERPCRAVVIEGDREKLFRVLVNLVDNAIKFTDEGQVLVSVEGDDGQVVLAVSDSGIGLSTENLNQIFERFFQARTSARGVGIGLTICKTIVEAHGGRIWAESAGEGQGAVFRVSLPAEDGP